MFTGIVKDMGEVVSVGEGLGGGMRLRIRTGFDLSKTDIGASMACDGCCLTIVEKTNSEFTVDVSNETLSKTTISEWKEGTRINLEKSMRYGDEIGGHIVSGHVDGLATLESLKPDGDCWRLGIRVPDRFAAYIVPKGSVALNGISLTINEVEGNYFGVCIIPHTWAVTGLSHVKEGQNLNLEVDMMARYAMRLSGQETA
ncbi:MAG TPA: riboflavin synthase [Micavibrio sp.]|jgi:riboflavin synthase